MPRLTESTSWLPVLATHAHAQAFVSMAVRDFNPGMSAEAVCRFVEHIASKSYTVSELRWAYEGLLENKWLADQVAGKTQNPYFLLPAIAEIIKRARQVRRQLSEGLLSEWDIGKLIPDVPELSRGDFFRAGFDYENRPLYRYAPGTVVSSEAEVASKLWGRGNE